MNEDPAIVRPGPEDNSLLTQQQNHRSEAIWNGEVKHLDLVLKTLYVLSKLYI